MWGFAALVVAIFFVLGGLALALPWRGVVAWAERHSTGAAEASSRYVWLLAAPVALIGLFVFSLLGPWDAAVCRQLHDACLDRISGWRLPTELAAVLLGVAVLAVGRLSKPYLAAAWARPLRRVSLFGPLKSKWTAVHSEVNRRCGATPLVVAMEDEALVCHVRGALKPQLYVSTGFIASLDHDELVGAVCHEIAHVRRGDLPLGLLAYVCHCLLFFMPTSRGCYQGYLDMRELAADDWAVAQTGKPLALAAALGKVGRAASLTPGKAGYGALLQRRIKRLLTPEPPTPVVARGRMARALPVLLAPVVAGSLMALHLVLESWGRGLLATLGVID
ncbi:heat shock protein HtpX [compost metagenome]